MPNSKLEQTNPPHASNSDNYIAGLLETMWDYAEEYLQPLDALLDQSQRALNRPPVFLREHAHHNVLLPPNADKQTSDAILASIERKERHRHFGSMRSSQALAQSVFGGLAVFGKLEVLARLTDEDGQSLFPNVDANTNVTLEHNVRHLGEPRPTSVDVWLEADNHRIAVECKLTESEFGTCSRPNLKEHKDSNFDSDYCDGTYRQQQARQSRCSLTEIGVMYWDYLPRLFDWPNNQDASPCMLRSTYQLCRNVLAACVTPAGEIDTEVAHALVVYDARNPAYQPDGLAYSQWVKTKSALKDKRVLRACSWQQIIGVIKDSHELDWLVHGLESKYGIVG